MFKKSDMAKIALEQMKEAENSAILEIEQRKEDIRKLQFDDLSDTACMMLSDGRITVGENDRENERIGVEAEVIIQSRFFVKTCSHEDNLKLVAEGILIPHGSEEEVKKIYKEARKYKRNVF